MVKNYISGENFHSPKKKKKPPQLWGPKQRLSTFDFWVVFFFAGFKLWFSFYFFAVFLGWWGRKILFLEALGNLNRKKGRVLDVFRGAPGFYFLFLRGPPPKQKIRGDQGPQIFFFFIQNFGIFDFDLKNFQGGKKFLAPKKKNPLAFGIFWGGTRSGKKKGTEPVFII